MAKNNGVMPTTIIRSIFIAMMNIIITEEMPTMPVHIMKITQMVQVGVSQTRFMLIAKKQSEAQVYPTRFINIRGRIGPQILKLVVGMRGVARAAAMENIATVSVANNGAAIAAAAAAVVVVVAAAVEATAATPIATAATMR